MGFGNAALPLKERALAEAIGQQLREALVELHNATDPTARAATASTLVEVRNGKIEAL